MGPRKGTLSVNFTTPTSRRAPASVIQSATEGCNSPRRASELLISANTPENVAKILPYRPVQNFAGWYEPGLPDRRRSQAGDVVLERISDDGASEGSRRRRHR